MKVLPRKANECDMRIARERMLSTGVDRDATTRANWQRTLRGDKRRGTLGPDPLLHVIVWMLLIIGMEQLQAFTLNPPSSRTVLVRNKLLPPILPLSLARQSSQEKVPFIIESILQPHDFVFREISEMCIDSFFNNGKASPWKMLQLQSLRTLQQGDLRRRRAQYPDTNIMLLARRVVPMPGTDDPFLLRSSYPALSQPLILDTSTIFNRPSASEVEYVRDQVVGFVEVTLRPYGLGSSGSGVSNVWPLGSSSINSPTSFDGDEVRPMVTNLAVAKTARRSGVASALMNELERCVVQQWCSDSGSAEVVLEVEHDNVAAQQFYRKRGYQVLFEDPTSRQYDVSGLWLQQKRCTRWIMRKTLHSVAWDHGVMTAEAISSVEKGLQRFKQLVFSQND
jgi:ribosomal protein S18 acetylase RimI-like enzyme